MNDKKVGRPTKFSHAIKEKIICLAKGGKTNAEIAEIIGIHVRTLENWKDDIPELLWALKEAKQVADELVVASLFSRAVGYSHDAVKVFFDSKSLKTIEHQYIERYPPDVTAAIFWLKNRQPANWREKTEVEHSGSIDSLPDSEIDAKLERLMALSFQDKGHSEEDLK